MEFTRLKNWQFFGTVETNSPYWIWIVATQVIDIPFGLAFLENFKFKKGRPHIVDMTIMISQRIRSIKPNSRMTQTKNISCGGDSSELKLENNKGSGSDGLHVIN